MLLKINEKIYLKEKKERVEITLGIAQEYIEYEIDKALSLAILIANNEKIKEGFIRQDRALLFKEITEQIERLKAGVDIQELDIHLHTKDLKTYVYSWDFNSFGNELNSFRHGLVKVKETQRPLGSIELGQRLNIKAISPVMNEGEYLGSAEVILGFKQIQKRLLERGINFFVLMERKHLDIAIRMKENPKVDDYVLVSSPCAYTCVEKLTGKLHSDVLENGYLESEGFVFGFLPFFNFNGERLGYLGIFFEQKLLKEPSILYLFERVQTKQKYEQAENIHDLIPKNKHNKKVNIR